MIGSILGGIGSLFGSFGSMAAGFSQKASQERIAQENLDFQQQQFEYQKALNQLQMEREDSTYQRTVNDMRQAGMSPLAMQSTNSAGSLNAGTAPQREQNDYSGILNSLYNITSQFSQLGQVMSGIARTDAETNFINAQADKIYQDIQFDKDTYEDRQKKIYYDRANSWADANQKYFDYRANAYYGFTAGMPDELKKHLFSLATGYVNVDREKYNPQLNYDNQYNDIYNYENELKWSNSEADIALKKSQKDFQKFDRVLDSFEGLLSIFSTFSPRMWKGR